MSAITALEWVARRLAWERQIFQDYFYQHMFLLHLSLGLLLCRRLLILGWRRLLAHGLLLLVLSLWLQVLRWLRLTRVLQRLLLGLMWLVNCRLRLIC